MIRDEKSWFGEMEYRVLEGKEGVKEAYDLMADTYDVSKYFCWTRKLETAEERVVKRWGDGFLGVCLDVGCGTGRYSLRLAKAGAEVVALDLSLKMLKRLRFKAKKHGVYDKVNEVLADGEHLPFREGAFDCLVCTLTFDHFEGCEKAAGGFSRVLKDDSTCIVSSFNSSTLRLFQRRYGFEEKVPFRTEETGPVLVFEVGHSADDLNGMFSEYGFRCEDVKGCCYWHLPLVIVGLYPFWLDSFFNLFRGLLRYAEIHAVLMRRKHGIV